MLIGSYTNTLDPKSRVIIPAAFRDDIELKCIITKGFEKCLHVYPKAKWDKLVERIEEELPSSQRDNRDTRRFIVGSAVECEIDKQGRILIPQKLREYANLVKDILFVGDLNKIQILNPDTYEEIDEEEVSRTLEEKKINV